MTKAIIFGRNIENCEQKEVTISSVWEKRNETPYKLEVSRSVQAMSKEELEKEAGDYADKHAFRVPYDGSNKFYDDVDFKASKEGYLAGAKSREKRIAKLERKLEQTEKELADYQFNYPTIKELEKEIAELKHNKKTVVELSDCLEELHKNKLAQAKELLQKWLDLFGYKVKFLTEQTKQFLKKDEGCPDCFCEDCIKDCEIKKFGSVEVEQ